jgi:hypothetical protein
LMDAEELDRILSPGRLSGLTLPTGAIMLPDLPHQHPETD